MDNDGFGARLRAARIMRDVSSPAAAARMLGIGSASYAGLEASVSCPAVKIAAYLAARYGITSAFLRSGISSTVADYEAEAQLGCVEPSHDTWELTDRQRVAGRLKLLRLMRDFRTASSAAIHFHWDMTRYTDVESGRAGFEPGQIVLLCRAYHVSENFFTDSAASFLYDPEFGDRHRYFGGTDQAGSSEKALSAPTRL